MRLIDADEVIAYCKRLIEVEEKQGSDKMNYGQERVFQTEAIMQHIQTISPTIDAIPREEVEELKNHLYELSYALDSFSARKEYEELRRTHHENIYWMENKGLEEEYYKVLFEHIKTRENK